jgi:hypothetical protein
MIWVRSWPIDKTAVVTAAVNDINPYYLTGAYSFSSIVSASFSNGVGVHQWFNRAVGRR